MICFETLDADLDAVIRNGTPYPLSSEWTPIRYPESNKNQDQEQ